MAAKVQGSIEWSDGPMPEGWDRGGHSWKVQLRYDGRQMTTPFYTGSALGEPTLRDVLECLLSDESSADQSFEEWCSDYGYDTDSRQAERTYKAVRSKSKKLRRLLGGNLAGILAVVDYDTELAAKRLAAEEWS